MKYVYICAFALSFAPFLWNCDGNSSSNETLALIAGSQALGSSSKPRGISFHAVVGDSEAVCGQEITGHGDSHSSSTVHALHVAGVMPIGLKDLRFYVSEFELVDENDNTIVLNIPDNGTWQYSGVTLLDFENASGSCTGTTATNKIVQIDLENKQYKTIRFTLGVPENLNHIDYSVSPSPLNISGMAWGWTMGYRFFVGEFYSNDSTSPGNSAVLHIGSSGCTEPSPGTYTCVNSNRPKIELSPSGGFNPFTQEIQFDLKKAFAGWDISAAGGGSKSCHSMGAMDGNCSAVYPNFGLDYSTGDVGSVSQSVFSILSK
ncbi:metallo-mystery pair system four-Cys motif protein [Leptospira langatensis]|uniref:Metallo-mystery pair system four-Cys motif protein n=1 Tax=Leptospira langatensis TaxID=2484983 RepID=A0A5F1ZYV0_9LEPT|nr:MbnP family copper-binding protein [Leptospira langatensis]TGJ98253.1 metallo-mystery pair system four-Cys motif protein [Leptospira langatensis]TGL43167.1 metallo-mystery pair system four-Cys motif protein [Leptospira langatensis]